MDVEPVLKQAFDAALGGQFEGLFACLFFLLGFANLYSLYYQQMVRRWPKIPERLVTAETERWGGEAFHISDQDYKNVVAYHYTVQGAEYSGNRFSAWVVIASHNLKWLLERQLDDLKESGTVDVIYNPARPEKSFLVRPGVFGMFVTLAFAVFCFSTPWLVFG
ncbi:MAG: DUF3592 domain-containing protein [Pseudomonadota bacterium]